MEGGGAGRKRRARTRGRRGRRARACVPRGSAAPRSARGGGVRGGCVVVPVSDRYRARTSRYIFFRPPAVDGREAQVLTRAARHPPPPAAKPCAGPRVRSARAPALLLPALAPPADGHCAARSRSGSRTRADRDPAANRSSTTERALRSPQRADATMGYQVGEDGLSVQDAATLDASTLTPLSPEVISRQATINIGARRSPRGLANSPSAPQSPVPTAWERRERRSPPPRTRDRDPSRLGLFSPPARARAVLFRGGPSPDHDLSRPLPRVPQARSATSRTASPRS